MLYMFACLEKFAAIPWPCSMLKYAPNDGFIYLTTFIHNSPDLLNSNASIAPTVSMNSFFPMFFYSALSSIFDISMGFLPSRKWKWNYEEIGMKWYQCFGKCLSLLGINEPIRKYVYAVWSVYSQCTHAVFIRWPHIFRFEFSLTILTFSNNSYAIIKWIEIPSFPIPSIEGADTISFRFDLFALVVNIFVKSWNKMPTKLNTSKREKMFHADTKCEDTKVGNKYK